MASEAEQSAAVPSASDAAKDASVAAAKDRLARLELERNELQRGQLHQRQADPEILPDAEKLGLTTLKLLLRTLTLSPRSATPISLDVSASGSQQQPAPELRGRLEGVAKAEASYALLDSLLSAVRAGFSIGAPSFGSAVHSSHSSLRRPITSAADMASSSMAISEEASAKRSGPATNQAANQPANQAADQPRNRAANPPANPPAN
ncbi:hypothetical protein KFL_000060960 [Klebsormidium nitens]|uniref:Uncharacterized protein n=1 Tax=Klebsormidium nitens TaxID=105231 RepID=A0A0U9HRE9_KLENI|nr:hypothetical protein KFL_000060960 [Klebsormidium nitens]|eukprot:GAQ78029.1 hypothetical protein KFL_000060960 [Klebsormidium nitens]